LGEDEWFIWRSGRPVSLGRYYEWAEWLEYLRHPRTLDPVTRCLGGSCRALATQTQICIEPFEKLVFAPREVWGGPCLRGTRFFKDWSWARSGLGMRLGGSNRRSEVFHQLYGLPIHADDGNRRVIRFFNRQVIRFFIDFQQLFLTGNQLGIAVCCPFSWNTAQYGMLRWSCYFFKRQRHRHATGFRSDFQFDPLCPSIQDHLNGHTTRQR